MDTTESTCHLCGLDLPGRPVENGNGEAFCCRGCLQVHSVLGEPERAAIAESGTVDSDLVRGALTDEIRSERGDGDETAFFRIDGMHCSTCEAFIESIATTYSGVATAHASYVTDTVRVDYDPDRTDEESIRNRLSGMGYRAYDRDDPIQRQAIENRMFGRLVAGILFGMMVMMQYVVIVYPTYFGGLFYDDRTTAFLTSALATGSGRYFFVMIWVLTTVVLLYTGGPLLKGAYVSLKTRQPNMDLLVSLAATSAYFYSVLAVILGQTDIYFDVTVAIIVVVTVGNYYEQTVKKSATERLSALTRAHVDEARRIADDGESTVVSLDALEPTDRILVNAGERIPVDGTVVDGDGAVDESIITGEALPKSLTVGDSVVGGSVLVDGSVIFEVGETVESSVDRIANLVWQLQSSNHGIQRLADRLATIFVPGVLVLGIGVSFIYLALGAPITAAILVGLTVLIVSCPCALGLATPLAVASSVREALERGIVVFDDTVFERLRGTDVIVFDKTGTLTTGTMSVIESSGPTDVLELAAILERRSAHPIASAIVSAFEPNRSPEPDPGGFATRSDGGVVDHGGSRPSTGPEGDPIEEISDFTRRSNGVKGTVDGVEVMVGHPDLFDAEGWAVPDEIRETVSDGRAFGRIPVVIGRDKRAEGIVVVGDEPRSGWDRVLGKLHDRGIHTVVLTGDDQAATAFFRDHPDVDQVFAGVPPEAKAETVRRLGAGRRTTMVGDGTNDAPALAAADLGIALGSGTALAADAADVAILSDDLADIDTVFDLSTAAGRRVKQNIGWALCYNGIAIPLAVGGLLNPLFAAVAMTLSSLLVVSNSSRALVADEPDTTKQPSNE